MTLLHTPTTTDVTRLLRGMLSTVVIEHPRLIGRSYRANGTEVRYHLADDVQDGRTLCGVRLSALTAHDVSVRVPRYVYEDAGSLQCGICGKRLREAVIRRLAAGVPTDVLVIPRRLAQQEPGLYVEEASDLGIRPGAPWPRVIRLDIGERVIDLIRVDRQRDADAPDGLLGYRVDRDGDLIVQDYVTDSGADVLRIYND